MSARDLDAEWVESIKNEALARVMGVPWPPEPPTDGCTCPIERGDWASPCDCRCPDCGDDDDQGDFAC